MTLPSARIFAFFGGGGGGTNAAPPVVLASCALALPPATNAPMQAHANTACKSFLLRTYGISLSYACGVSCRARAERACAPPSRRFAPVAWHHSGSPAPRIAWIRRVGKVANHQDFFGGQPRFLPSCTCFFTQAPPWGRLRRGELLARDRGRRPTRADRPAGALAGGGAAGDRLRGARRSLRPGGGSPRGERRRPRGRGDDRDRQPARGGRGDGRLLPAPRARPAPYPAASARGPAAAPGRPPAAGGPGRRARRGARAERRLRRPA